ncbi:hypothetical protein Mal64_38390 [Pseudobythopirellula maris]|uniref:Uncharacterized protein n=1 Tax=Pseudobythopirellula maris TaxID=2527991 RepID=A0A5C5ZFV8_9BACT|nr:hypothetical protein [Pseudobythopirellula maris]TWT86299.1 hypothetical protein Mal64_38390 [Pseudobythopirellula maris]
MATTNRASRITKIVTALKKQFKPTTPPQLPLLDTLLYACLVENSNHEAAQKAFETLRGDYFDWNEVRVSTRTELAGVLKGLNDPVQSADRLKRTLQSVFESVYAFDIETMKKQNLGQSVKQLEKHDGVTPFIVAYAVQNGLGGHNIPVNKGLLLSLVVLDVITEAEAKKGQAPGLERAIPKNKGVEAGSLLHQLGVEVGRSPYGPAARKLLLAIDPKCKDRLPKRLPKPEPKPKPKPEPAAKKPAAKTEAKPPETKKPEAKKPAKKAAPAEAAAPAKKSTVKKAAAKPADKKKPATKKTASKAAPKSGTTKKKAATKKAAKPAAKKKVVKKKKKAAPSTASSAAKSKPTTKSKTKKKKTSASKITKRKPK